MKKELCFCALLALVFTAKAQIVSLNKTEIALLRESIKGNSRYQKVFEPFQKAADKALAETPNPLKIILSQGLLAGDPKKVESLKALEDAGKVYALALAYKYSNNVEYLNKATGFLTAWASVNKATDDPINETKLEDMVTGYDLIRTDLKLNDRTLIDGWMRAMANAQLNSKYAQGSRGTAVNNWNSHRIKMFTLIAYTLHNNSYQSGIFQALEQQLNVNLNPDGSTRDLVERDAFHYQTYDIEPLLSACIAIFRATGKNYFMWQTANGSTLKKCVDYMSPFMTGEKTHPEFVNSKVPFDKKRAENGEKGYAPGTLFEPVNGIYTFSLAAYFDDPYVQTIRKAARDESFMNWQMALNDLKNKAVK